ncbi:nitroreductase/quinone reductase family protein [Actinopolymorpha sp. B17G11]|uniref:nitroreductase/quinone reductase family protein n=1 Tax=Actinopolymorpha sp. B17G11 TaxID=3160861 RepID=UPI0032E4B9ED
MPDDRPPAHDSLQQQVIDEFRARGGVVGGRFEGTPLLLLTTGGARTGRPHTTPATYARDGDRLVIFASNAGGPRNPDWYHNLLADPNVVVEIGEQGEVRTHLVLAEPLHGEERDRLYALQAQRVPAYAEYQAMTSRRIPVVALRPVDLTGGADRVTAIGAQLTQVHQELRRALDDLRSRADDLVAGRQAPADGAHDGHSLDGVLLEHCLSFCAALHMHHLREDGGFTAFETEVPGVAPLVERLRREHRVVGQTLTRLRELVARLGSTPGAADAVTMRAELEQLAVNLEEHFRYEEESLIPALAAAAQA